MKVYFIVSAKMKDEVEYKKYLEKCDEFFCKYKGRYLAVDEDFRIIEGKNNSSRIILIEFDSESDFDEWYKSDEYQGILGFRLNGSDCNSVLVHGK
jgi:uncharacterized protein (DUF1330 family)